LKLHCLGLGTSGKQGGGEGSHQTVTELKGGKQVKKQRAGKILVRSTAKRKERGQETTPVKPPQKKKREYSQTKTKWLPNCPGRERIKEGWGSEIAFNSHREKKSDLVVQAGTEGNQLGEKKLAGARPHGGKFKKGKRAKTLQLLMSITG